MTREKTRSEIGVVKPTWNRAGPELSNNTVPALMKYFVVILVSPDLFKTAPPARCTKYQVTFPPHPACFQSRCFCGNTDKYADGPLDDSACDMACTGDNSMICGGRDAINVYTF